MRPIYLNNGARSHILRGSHWNGSKATRNHRVIDMARVTVEDCILKVPNRFELVMMASQRSRDIASGADISIERDNDKNPVVALREIADETVPLNDLGDSVVRGLQKHVEVDEPEEEDPMELMTAAALTDESDLQGMQVRYTDEPIDAEDSDAGNITEPPVS